jgi:hypothetical protein
MSSMTPTQGRPPQAYIMKVSQPIEAPQSHLQKNY